MRLEIAIDDLAFVTAGAIARPVNAGLRATTGLQRSLEVVAGNALLARLRVNEPLDVGAAVVTGAGALAADLMIHAVVMTDEEPVTRSGVQRATTSALRGGAHGHRSTAIVGVSIHGGMILKPLLTLVCLATLAACGGDDSGTSPSTGGTLVVEDLVVGTGATAASGDTVTVHYRGTFTNGTVFDQSYGGNPFTFRLGTGAVIAGFDQGVTAMKWVASAA